MSFGAGLGDLIFIIEGCVNVCKKVDSVGGQIEDIQNRLEEILGWVKPIQAHLNEDYGPAKNYSEAETIQAIVDKMKVDATDMQKIFERFYQTRKDDDMWGFARRIRFAVGSSTKELETLITTNERRATNLDRQVQLMDIKYLQKHVKNAKKPLYGTVKRRDVKILFVDPGNNGRSSAAQRYTIMMRDWTRMEKKPWFITTIHSAGIHVRDPNGLSELQDQLGLPTIESGRPPSKWFQWALIETSHFSSSYKKHVQERLERQVGRGLSRTTFKDYDYILVFTFRDNVDLQKLKAKTRTVYGTSVVPKDKGKIVMLGDYGNHNCSEIYSPKFRSEKPTYQDWINCVYEIKASVKGWLREEFEWEPPQQKPLSICEKT